MDIPLTIMIQGYWLIVGISVWRHQRLGKSTPGMEGKKRNRKGCTRKDHTSSEGLGCPSLSLYRVVFVLDKFVLYKNVLLLLVHHLASATGRGGGRERLRE